MNVFEGVVQLVADFVLPAEWREWADVLLAAAVLCAGVAAWQAFRAACSPGDFGSGNNPWFRHIDSTPRQHQKKHFLWSTCGSIPAEGSEKLNLARMLPRVTR